MAIEMQTSLFDQDVCEKIKIPNGELWWFPNWLSPSESHFYFGELYKELAWQQSTIQIAGQGIKIPRLNAWYGEKNTRYQYSGITFEPLPFTEVLETLKIRVLQAFKSVSSNYTDSNYNFSINSALANLYRDENDGVAWHADDEPELGNPPQIASLSFGEPRRFLLKPKLSPIATSNPCSRTKPMEILLTPGSLLFMLGDIQNHYVHSIPKENSKAQTNLIDSSVLGPRINITFRHVYAD